MKDQDDGRSLLFDDGQGLELLLAQSGIAGQFLCNSANGLVRLDRPVHTHILLLLSKSLQRDLLTATGRARSVQDIFDFVLPIVAPGP